MIFLTSNLGTSEVNKLMMGGMGFGSKPEEDFDDLDQKIYRAATAAARRKFSPEFMNRIDKVIVFRALQRPHLERILDIELSLVQERVMTATDSQFVFKCTESARDFLLREGTDTKFGARHLKRAIERHLVFPLSNLLATHQIELGDLITLDFDAESSKLMFLNEPQGALVGSKPEVAEEMAIVPASSHRAGAGRALARRASRD
jgi:ATP-dependent Clp protease ATP-binding subunit ClpA